MMLIYVARRCLYCKSVLAASGRLPETLDQVSGSLLCGGLPP
ncbi:hypothetical protein [Eikenella corrodens]|nr:hypothetical protein [Eikenella corrodens]